MPPFFDVSLPLRQSPPRMRYHAMKTAGRPHRSRVPLPREVRAAWTGRPNSARAGMTDRTKTLIAFDFRREADRDRDWTDRDPHRDPARDGSGPGGRSRTGTPSTGSSTPGNPTLWWSGCRSTWTAPTRGITVQARRFANRLHARSGLPVTLVDERLSTREAWTRLIESGSRRDGPDPVAAQIILEGWFAEHDRSEGLAGG